MGKQKKQTQVKVSFRELFKSTFCKILILFSLASLFFLIFGAGSLIGFEVSKNGFSKAEGELVSFEEKDHQPQTYFRYEADGETHQAADSYYDSNMKLGDKVEIFYNPNDYSDAVISTATRYVMGLINIGTGILFGAFTLVLWKRLIKRYRKEKEKTMNYQIRH